MNLQNLTLVSTFLLTSLASHQSFANPFEAVPANEAADIALITQTISDTVQKEFETSGEAKRDAHHKTHGCVDAKVQVFSNLPADLKKGVFAQAKSFSAKVRFSNGNGAVQDDHTGDGRGMALKLLDVSGEKLLDDEKQATTQDFLMINHPVFFVRNASEYVKFTQATSNNTVLFWFLSPMRVFHEFKIVNAIRGKKIKSPLEARYFSMTASLLGDQPIKFSTRPCDGQTMITPSDSANFLGDNLAAHLKQKAACFTFEVQRRTQPEKMPIEDPTIEWKETEAPFIPVAQIQIPEQTPDRTETCQNLSFTPWHSLPEHRPLGGISRVRKVVYQTISTVRHKLNGSLRREPQN